MIKSGFNKLVALAMPWPPSAPEFVGLCKPSKEDFGIPDQQEAWSGVDRYRRNKKYQPTPFEYALFRNLSREFFDLDRLTVDAHRKRIGVVYQALSKRVMAGEALEDAPVLVEDKNKAARKQVSKESAKRHLENIKTLLS